MHVTLVNQPYPKGGVVHQHPPFTLLGMVVGVTSATLTDKSALKRMKRAEEASPNCLTILVVASNLV